MEVGQGMGGWKLRTFVIIAKLQLITHVSGQECLRSAIASGLRQSIVARVPVLGWLPHYDFRRVPCSREREHHFPRRGGRGL